MTVKAKEIEIPIEINRFKLVKLNNNSTNFLEDKLIDAKNALKEEIEKETDLNKKTQYEKALQTMNSNSNVNVLEGEVLIIGKNEEQQQEDDNDYGTLKYNNIKNIEENYDDIINELDNDAFNEEEVAKSISNALINGTEISEDASKAANALLPFINTEIDDKANQDGEEEQNGSSSGGSSSEGQGSGSSSEEQGGGSSGEGQGSGSSDNKKKNPYDDDSVMPFNTSVSLPACKGLRREYLKVMRECKNYTNDEYAEKYASGITKVTQQYLLTGVKCITTHVGGSYSAVGVGNSLVINCAAGYANCFNSIMSYYRRKNSEYLSAKKEAQVISDAFSAMYNIATLTEMITGIYIQPASPPYTMPLLEQNNQWQIDSSKGKKLLYASLLAGYTYLENLVNSSKKTDIYKSIGVGTKYEDTDDIIATFMAAGLKAMIAVTTVKTKSVHSNQGGNGLLLPIGT